MTLAVLDFSRQDQPWFASSEDTDQESFLIINDAWIQPSISRQGSLSAGTEVVAGIYTRTIDASVMQEGTGDFEIQQLEAVSAMDLENFLRKLEE